MTVAWLVGWLVGRSVGWLVCVGGWVDGWVEWLRYSNLPGLYPYLVITWTQLFIRVFHETSPAEDCTIRGPFWAVSLKNMGYPHDFPPKTQCFFVWDQLSLHLSPQLGLPTVVWALERPSPQAACWLWLTRGLHYLSSWLGMIVDEFLPCNQTWLPGKSFFVAFKWGKKHICIYIVFMAMFDCQSVCMSHFRPAWPLFAVKILQFSVPLFFFFFVGGSDPVIHSNPIPVPTGPGEAPSPRHPLCRWREGGHMEA